MFTVSINNLIGKDKFMSNENQNQKVHEILGENFQGKIIEDSKQNKFKILSSECSMFNCVHLDDHFNQIGKPITIEHDLLGYKLVE